MVELDKTSNDTNSFTLSDAEYRAFRDEYKSYSSQARAAMNILLARIENLQLGMEADRQRDLIDTVTHRIKTMDSCAEKLRRNNRELTAENLRNEIRDMAGIRVVTPFEDDIFIIADALKNQSGITIRRTKDYVSEPKENGYASLHLTIEVEVFFLNEKEIIPVEVQIRDKTMDAWAAIEHICGYKCQSGKKSLKVIELFKKLAQYLASFRKTAMQLRDLDENAKK